MKITKQKSDKEALTLPAKRAEMEAMQTSTPTLIDYRYRLPTSQGADLEALSVPFLTTRIGLMMSMNMKPA